MATVAAAVAWPGSESDGQRYELVFDDAFGLVTGFVKLSVYKARNDCRGRVHRVVELH
jgi:hypothetical protein